MLKPLKNYFNLIEIAMALGIIGFGVASVMSVFPAALQNANNSISENYASNAADLFFSYLSTEAKKEPDWDGANDSLGDGDDEVYDTKWNLLFSQLGSSKPANPAGPTLAETRTAEGSFSSIPSNNYVEDSTINGVYKVTQGDFIAVARVWTAANAVYFEKGASSEQMIGSMKFLPHVGPKIDVVEDAQWNSDFKKYAAGVYVELSWPDHKPYSNREKRVYFMEFFNPWSMN